MDDRTMDTTETTGRYQRKTRNELRAMSNDALEEERASLLECVAVVHGQLAAAKILAERGGQKPNPDWVIRAATSVKCMAESARWIYGQLLQRKSAAASAELAERAELALKISREKRRNAEAGLEMQRLAQAKKLIRDAEKATMQRELERIFVDVAKDALTTAVFSKIMSDARARQLAQQP